MDAVVGLAIRHHSILFVDLGVALDAAVGADGVPHFHLAVRRVVQEAGLAEPQPPLPWGVRAQDNLRIVAAVEQAGLAHGRGAGCVNEQVVEEELPNRADVQRRQQQCGSLTAAVRGRAGEHDEEEEGQHQRHADPATTSRGTRPQNKPCLKAREGGSPEP